MILKVTLPEETEPSTPTRENICDRNNYELGANSVLGEAASTSAEESQSPSRSLPRNLSSGEMDTSPQNSAQAGQSNSSLIGERGDNEPVQSCECQGACSCKLIKSKKVARCSSESRVTIASSSLGPGKATITKKRSFKEMMQMGINRASPSAIIPHPASMTITVRPPRSRRYEKKGDSKSAGPSSPTSKMSPEFDSEELNDGKSLGHCRSSSGPSDLSASMSCISDLPSTSLEAVSSQKSASENQILDASNLSQVKHLASVLFDGLQQSFNFRNEEENSFNQAIGNEDDKMKAPVTWTNLLIPSRKKTPDQNEISVPKSERPWTACDTLPLLSNGSQPPAIVKFDDKNKSIHKSTDLQETPSSSTAN